MEESIEEDWAILRRKSVDRITTTMNVGEALTRLSTVLWTFLCVEDDVDRNFFLAIAHERQKDSPMKLNFRVSLSGFKDKDNIALFEPVNKLPFCEELEAAVEQAFNEVRKILLKFNEERKAHVDAEQEALQKSKETLMRLERNIVEMGRFDPNQIPLPFPS